MMEGCGCHSSHPLIRVRTRDLCLVRCYYNTQHWISATGACFIETGSNCRRVIHAVRSLPCACMCEFNYICGNNMWLDHYGYDAIWRWQTWTLNRLGFLLVDEKWRLQKELNVLFFRNTLQLLAKQTDPWVQVSSSGIVHMLRTQVLRFVPLTLLFIFFSFFFFF